MVKATNGKEANVVTYKIPSVGSVLKLDRHCPHCHRNHGRIHSGIIHRRISDLKARSIPQRRMKCPYCGTTWTVRADGVGHGRQRSERLRGIGVILYMLGLSYRAVEQFLPCLECCGSSSSIERDVTEIGQNAKDLHLSAPRMRLGVLGVDGTGAAMAGRNAGILFYVDVQRQKLIYVEPLKETNTAKVRRHVARVFQAMGADELRSDEHSVYKGIVPQGKHSICLTHWRKSKGKRAYDLYRQAVAENRSLEADSMLELLEILRIKPRPPTAPPQLDRLVRRYINARRGLLWKINQLLQHVERTWEKVSNDLTDATNNVTERIIGLDFKIRAKTMRGFKSLEKVLAHPYLSSFLRGEEGICDLRKVI